MAGLHQVVSPKTMASMSLRSALLAALLTALAILAGSSHVACAEEEQTPSATYQAHVQNIGWMGLVGSGQVVGTTGRSLAMEAVEIKLTGNLSTEGDRPPHRSPWPKAHQARTRRRRTPSSTTPAGATERHGA